jgi:PiT family inorganic phosphate transporter
MALFSLIAVIVTALLFDFTNGFHDTANMVATSISTRALPPRVAVGLTAVLNFVGAFLSIKVAETIGNGIVESGLVTQEVVFAGLLGAIIWNLITWYFGLPSSSSHALIGGLVGAMLAAAGLHGVLFGGVLFKVIIPALAAVMIAFAAAGIVIIVLYKLFGKLKPRTATKGFRFGQIPTSALLAIAHGTNDAQKTMGVIALSLVAYGTISPDHFYVPFWVIIASASSIALGTYVGGWKIIKTMGSKIIKMDPAQGFTAQGVGALVILGSSALGYPLSTTHVMSSSVMGAGAAKRVSAVRWGVAKNIVVAWLLTLPCAAAVSAAAYWILELLGSGAPGVLIIILAAILVAVILLLPKIAARKRRQTATQA